MMKSNDQKESKEIGKIEDIKMQEKMKEIVKEVLELNDDVAENLTENTDLLEIGLDSMTCVEIVVNLEAEFGITVEEEDLLVENMATIDLLCQLVEKYQ